MGQTLAIWKWRTAWPFRSDRKVWRLLADDKVPFSLAPFDARGLARELLDRFGRNQEELLQVDICDFKGHRANWLVLSVSWSTRKSTLIELVNLIEDRRLYVYTTQ